jgi:hypothetical protein
MSSVERVVSVAKTLFQVVRRGCRGMWSAVTPTPDGPAPSSRSKHSATLLGGHVYLLGGRNGNLPLKDLWRYSLGEHYCILIGVPCPLRRSLLLFEVHIQATSLRSSKHVLY